MVAIGQTLSSTDYNKLKGLASTAKPTLPKTSTEEAQKSEVETWLMSFGVKYIGPHPIPLTSIDEKTSRGHNSREVSIVPDTVDRVVQGLKDGVSLPAIVVYPAGSKFTIIDGNNREAGHKKAGKLLINAYVVDENTPSELLARMIVNANAHHGVTPPVNFRVQQAAFLVTAHGLTRELACKDAGVTTDALKNYFKLLEAEGRAKNLRIAGFADLPDSTKRFLNRLTLDSAFVAASHVVIEHSISSPETEKLVKTVSVVSSESAMIAVIEGEKESREKDAVIQKATGRRIASPKQALVTGLGKLANIDPYSLASQILTDIDGKEMISRTRAVRDNLLRIENEITKRHPGVE